MSFIYDQNLVPGWLFADSQLYMQYMLVCSAFANFNQKLESNIQTVTDATIAQTLEEEISPQDLQNMDEIENELDSEILNQFLDEDHPDSPFDFMEEMEDEDDILYAQYTKAAADELDRGRTKFDAIIAQTTRVHKETRTDPDWIGAGGGQIDENAKEFDRLINTLRLPFDEMNELSKIQKPFYDEFIARCKNPKQGSPWKKMERAIPHQRKWCKLYQTNYLPTLEKIKHFATEHNIDFDLDTVITMRWYPDDPVYNQNHEVLLPTIFRNYSKNVESSDKHKNRVPQNTLTDHVVAKLQRENAVNK